MNWLRSGLTLCLLLLVVLVFIAGLPANLFRAKAHTESSPIDALLIMGFGFELNQEGQMIAGDANQFLLDWSLANYPEVSLFFVQEAVWRAACPAESRLCFIGNTQLRRIDKHRDDLDLRTMDIAVCGLERMKAFAVRHVVLVAHDAQLWRTQNNFERAKELLCEDCLFSVAAVPDSPYPRRSAQWRNRFEWRYRFIDLAARLRYHPVIYKHIPTSCPSLMPATE